MRKALILLLVTIAPGCGPKAEAQRLLAKQLRDPGSVEVADMIVAAKTKATCGRLTAANGYGGRSQERMFYIANGEAHIAPPINDDPTEAITNDAMGDAIRRLNAATGMSDSGFDEFMSGYNKACDFG